jgi:hypothetical protein
MTAFLVIRSFYPMLIGVIYFLASPDFIMLNGIFKLLSDDLEIIIKVYTISLSILFLSKYIETGE